MDARRTNTLKNEFEKLMEAHSFRWKGMNTTLQDQKVPKDHLKPGQDDG